MKAFIYVLLMSLVAVTAFAQEDAMASAEKAKSLQLATFCSACHGSEGYSIGEYMATIQGQNKDYLTNTLNEFASGERYSTLMGLISKGYDPDERVLLATHFSSMQWKAKSVNVDNTLAKTASALAEENCSSCHNIDAESYVPKINGQQAQVLYRALLQFKAELRNGENAGEMSLVMDFTDKQLEALAEYYASMK